jgi:nicotinate phosphoribosyltransferase
VSRENDDGVQVPVAKAAKNKISKGGRKYALRRLDGRGVASAEVIGIGHRPDRDSNDRSLLEQFVKNGEPLPGFTGAEAVQRAAERHRLSLEELPGTHRRLQRGEAVIPTEFEEQA